MVRRIAPGLCIALALGLVFCFSGGERERLDRRRDALVRVTRAHAATTTPGTSIFHTARPRRAPAPPAPAPAPGADTVFGGQTVMAMHPPAALPAAEVPAAPRSRAPSAPRAAARPHAYGLTSGAALASLSGQAAPAVPTAHSPSFAYPTLPPKGIAFRGSGMMYNETKTASQPGENAYAHDGTVYSLGADYDWSVDSTIGVSIDFLQAGLKGQYADESRQTDTTGYFVNAHYHGDLFGKVPFRAKAMYGWLDQETSGWADDFWSMNTRHPWREETRRSHMFGVSASFLYPLINQYGYRVTPEIGFDYRQLRAKEFVVDITPDNSMRLLYPSMTAASLASYISTSVSRDFQQVWGVVTPRISCGYSYESSDTAGAVRALGASAAYPAYLDAGNMTAAPPRFDVGPKYLWTYALGVDMKVLGGWDVSARYEKKSGREYDRDAFRLEIGRCF